MGLEIGYAYTSFKWENNAKRNAGVTVAVVSLRNVQTGVKHVYTDGVRVDAKNINGYLVDSDNVFVSKRSTPLSNLPRMSFGSMPNDSGALILTSAERDQLIASEPTAGQLVKRFMGASEFIADTDRYALWIEASSLGLAKEIPDVAKRIERVREHRLDSDRASTQALANVPYRFGEVRYKPTDSIIVPSVSSERREYIPIGYLDPDTVVSNLAYAVYDAEPWVFALLTSRMHMTWARAVGGRMKTDYRYSNTIVYNNFPVPPLSALMREQLTAAALRVLDVREYHCERTLADLYDPDLMPDDLRQAHAEVDALVDSIYSKRGYETDEQGLSDLFAVYEAMTAAEAPAKKTRSARK